MNIAKRANLRVAAPSRMRDRAETERRILAAVGETLAENGFQALGVNAVAKRAGVDKVLIYRYFGGLPELLAAYAEHGDFWYRLEDIAGANQPPSGRNSLGAWMALAMRRHIAWLKARPITLEIMAWETIENNELTRALAEVREKRGMAIMEHIARRLDVPDGVDLPALVALFAAATNYLLIRARGVRHFQGLDLRRDEGWERLISMMGRVTDSLTMT
jgi:AcrR family transcriptional regulator